jgi:acetyl esterase
VAELRTEPGAVELVRGALARRIGRLPESVQRALSLRRRIVIDGQALDPTLQAVLALRPPRDLMGSPAAESRARFRRELIAVQGPRTPVGRVDELQIEGAAGPLHARHYTPPGRHSYRPPLLVYLHGGGFVLGDPDTHDELCRVLCVETAHHVLSVDYRLAPEHQFPAPLDDAVAAFRWAATHAGALGADPARVAVGGDSAGGTLSALVAQLTARDKVRPCAQLLIYPATDRSRKRASHQLFDTGFFLSMHDVRAFHTLYVGNSGAPVTDPRISPLLAADLAGLPPALVVVAGFDVLRDEGEAYAAALEAAGTRTVVQQAPSLGHGFVNLTMVSGEAARTVRAMAAAWKELMA